MGLFENKGHGSIQVGAAGWKPGRGPNQRGGVGE